MDKHQAEVIARDYIPNIFGSMLQAWIIGFLGHPPKGIHRYPRDSACEVYRKLGIDHRKDWESK